MAVEVDAAVVGAGYVGLATAVVLPEQGHHVVLVERDPERLAALANGLIPFQEPGLPEAYATQHAGGRTVPATARQMGWTS
jgi:UDPglucose 6-dehydrogenase